ncbi:MAG TPA: hypothetical protein ACQGQH_03295 [Xylella sp.]
MITCVFTGRPARALRNGFMNRHHTSALLGYPAMHHLTRPLLQAAVRGGKYRCTASMGWNWTPPSDRWVAADVIQHLKTGL